jgi:undecaprenyl-diphosphatase
MLVKAFASTVLARFVIVEFIRFLWQRQRPLLVEPNVNVLFANATPSFPSGHAAFAFGLATIVYLYNKKWGVVFFILAFLVSIARVFVGVHWPSDILVGAIIGILSGWLVNIVAKRLYN